MLFKWQPTLPWVNELTIQSVSKVSKEKACRISLLESYCGKKISSESLPFLMEMTIQIKSDVFSAVVPWFLLVMWWSAQDSQKEIWLWCHINFDTCSVQIIPRPIVTGESIVAWDESFIPVSSPIGQVPQNITKKRFSRRNSCIFLTKWWPSLELGKPFACFENDIIGRKS